MTAPISLLATDPLGLLLLVFVIVVAISVHEASHAFAAVAQGDPTPREQGRLTLNPVRHLDPMGSVLFLMAGFGWGRPVQFVPAKLRRPRLGAVVVALAGPLSNLALALAAVILLRFLVDPDLPLSAPGNAIQIVNAFLTINVLLAVFNLIPIPPLDGSHLLPALLPARLQPISAFVHRYGVFLLLALVLVPVFVPELNWLGPLVTGAQGLLLRLVGLEQVEL